MKNENRAVFDRMPEPIDYAFDLPAEPYNHPADTDVHTVPASFVSRVISWIGTRWCDRRNRLALLELSEDQLKDIGISRCQAYGGYSRYRRSEAHHLESRP
jgi:uncharacterized protein YjiS (DUF1127 family)